MEPVSSKDRSSTDDVTPVEIEEGACLPREPEPLESRLTEGPPPPPSPAVRALVDKQPASTPSAVPPNAEPSASGASGKSSAHPGVALSIGFNLAAPGKAIGIEGSVGIVVDLAEPRLSVFTSSGSGTVAAPGVSAGVSAQASVVGNVEKFWGSGEELGINFPRLGVTLDFATPAPGGPIELNGATASIGAGIGVDGHHFETTTEGWGLQDIKDALSRAAGLPGPRRFGP